MSGILMTFFVSSVVTISPVIGGLSSAATGVNTLGG
jgi:hypothetical protein